MELRGHVILQNGKQQHLFKYDNNNNNNNNNNAHLEDAAYVAGREAHTEESLGFYKHHAAAVRVSHLSEEGLHGEVSK